MAEDASRPRRSHAEIRLRRDGTVLGPFPRRHVRMLAHLGRLEPDAEISTDGVVWTRVAEVPWLSRRPSRRERDEAERYEYVERLTALTPRTPATWTLVALNAAAWVACLIAGLAVFSPKAEDLIAVGGNYGPRVYAGEWWRLLTSTFLHVGVVHLYFNMVVLWSVGPLLERFVGTAGFLVVYLGSGILASLSSLAVHPWIVSVGASGAIFGVAGGLLPVLWRQRGGTMPRALLRQLGRAVATMIAVNVSLGIVLPGVDNAAHVGGLLGGALLGLLVAHPSTAEDARGRGRRAAWGALAAAAAIGGVVLMLPRPNPVHLALVEGLRADERAERAQDAFEFHVGRKDQAHRVPPMREALPGLAEAERRLREVETTPEWRRRWDLGVRLLTARREALRLEIEGFENPQRWDALAIRKTTDESRRLRMELIRSLE